ncbi:hypothetical protein KQ41_06970 [Lysinibacillus fusiformis]|uniref:type IV secretory system conjugative DNA transfer family protein n=1 Tax=Lysinibacillus fusiformis TaxID=28031 RepID=UPI000502630C|nr:TraM recognition domain-containing protein [Lysinibacillus fusiformis]KGA83771.1 hypothetical protein KQ41_06970 [Lysinibacillus fusiformis]
MKQLKKKEGKIENRFARLNRIAKIEEFIRIKFHLGAVTALSFINVFILVPIALCMWLGAILGNRSMMLMQDWSWGMTISFWILPLLTWYYSTITIPYQKDHKYILDFNDTVRGRWISAIANVGSLHVMTWAVFAKYVVEYYLGYLASIRLDAAYKPFLLTTDLDSFILILFVLPTLISGLMIFIQVRDYMVHKDMLSESFMTWQAPIIRRFTHKKLLGTADIIIGYQFKTMIPIVLKEAQRFLHEAVVGATGSGKTSTTLLLRIAQDLINIATGRRKMGIVFLEPKGDGVDDVLKMCKKLKIPDEKVKVIDATKAFSIKFNPFIGPSAPAAATFEGTVNALAGDQDEFFKGQQNEAASTYTKLAKIAFGEKTNIFHIQRMFTDPRYLANIVESIREQITTNREKQFREQKELNMILDSFGTSAEHIEQTEHELMFKLKNLSNSNAINEHQSKLNEIQELKKRNNLLRAQQIEVDNTEQIILYFENEVLLYKVDQRTQQPIPYPKNHIYANQQMVESKKDKFVTGAKKYLNDIALNDLLKNLFIGADGEEVFDADQFLREGGVLLVNTSLAELDELSLMFGQFFIRQFQSAIFRRPKEGRIPIFFYIDEFPLYVNEAFERILTLGRSYNVGAVIAMQSIGQLEGVKAGYQDIILGNASSKTVFGRGPNKDNEYFSLEFGEKEINEESLNESASPMTSEDQKWGYRLNTAKKKVARFSTTAIRELPFKHMIVQIVDETNSIAPPLKAVGRFVNEARFIKPYLKLKKSDIKSNQEKEVVGLVENALKGFNKPEIKEEDIVHIPIGSMPIVDDEVKPFDKSEDELLEVLKYVEEVEEFIEQKTIAQQENSWEQILYSSEDKKDDVSTIETLENKAELVPIHIENIDEIKVSKITKEGEQNIENLMKELHGAVEGSRPDNKTVYNPLDSEEVIVIDDHLPPPEEDDELPPLEHAYLASLPTEVNQVNKTIHVPQNNEISAEPNSIKKPAVQPYVTMGTMIEDDF